MPNLIHDEFRTNYPDALGWLVNPPTVALHDQRFLAYQRAFDAANPRRLTDEQVTQFTALMRGINLLGEDEPATMYQGAAVPNGVFSVTDEDSQDSETFNIHTVTSGPLTGQRALKRKIDGRFKGFGSITRVSGWSLWARFNGEIDAEWMTFALAFRSACRQLNFEQWMSGQEFRIQHEGRWYYVQMEQRRCLSCNVVQSPPLVDGYCPNCQGSRMQVTTPPPPRPRRVISAQRMTTAPIGRPIYEEVTVFLLSEVGGVEIR